MRVKFPLDYGSPVNSKRFCDIKKVYINKKAVSLKFTYFEMLAVSHIELQSSEDRNLKMSEFKKIWHEFIVNEGIADKIRKVFMCNSKQK